MNIYKRKQDASKSNKEFLDILELAKGKNRSFAQYSRDAGISQAAIARIVQGDYIPSARTISKLTSKEASPQGGVTYGEMMKAAGLCTNETFFIATDNPASVDGYKLFKASCIPAIYTTLMDKGIPLKKESEIKYDFNSHENLFLTLYDQPITEWIFDFVYIPSDETARTELYQSLGKILFHPLNKTTKITLVTNSSSAFQYAKRYEHALDIRGEISVALFDEKTLTIIDECYLSNYNKQDTSNEIYLIKK